MVVEFRRRTLLPLPNVLERPHNTIPKLTHSSLPRYLRQHSILGCHRIPTKP